MKDDHGKDQVGQSCWPAKRTAKDSQPESGHIPFRQLLPLGYSFSNPAVEGRPSDAAGTSKNRTTGAS